MTTAMRPAPPHGPSVPYSGTPEIGLRPWGYYVVLSEGPNYKVKRFLVNAGQRLSLQKHRKRQEHWFVVRGRALVTRDGRTVPLEKGESIDIPQGAVHRVENPGKEELVIIEVQMGEYVGEDDIERMEDDYGRP